MRVALVGTPGHPLFENALCTLHQGFDLQLVGLTEGGSGKTSIFSALREYGFRFGFEWFLSNRYGGQLSQQRPAIQTTSIPFNDWQLWITQLEQQQIDIQICCSTNRMFPESVIQASTWTVNTHPGLLPLNRGPDPIYWGIILGEAKFGLSTHLMTTQIDRGPLLSQTSIVRPSPCMRVRIEKLLSKTMYGLFSDTFELLRTANFDHAPQQGGEYRPKPTLKNIKKYRRGG